MATRRQRAKSVGTGKVEDTQIEDEEEWAVLRAVVINTAPKPRSTALGQSAIREVLNDDAVDPYEALPDVEPVYPNELARDIAVGLFLVYDRAWRYAREQLHGSGQESEEVGNYLSKAMNLVDRAYQLTIEEMIERVFKQLPKSPSAHEFKYSLLDRIRMNPTELRTLGRDKVVAVLESKQKEAAAMSRLEQTLAKFEARHLVAKLPDGAYVATREGIESYLRSPFSEAQLFVRNPT
ncbi:hypothetical protein HYU20_02040 [Candidatus Woesearchaeota archaeon]|nr:hypothetical protein [Candidatus Woesearchaeota archaeon]